MDLAELANAVVALGYKHRVTPKAHDQLLSSLSVLPQKTGRIERTAPRTLGLA